MRKSTGSTMAKSKKRTMDVKDLNFFPVYVVSTKCTQKVLYKIFSLGCPKPVDMSLRDYLITQKGMSNKLFKTRFDRSQREKIENDKSGVSFDVTLLYVCIQTACVEVAEATDEGAWLTKDESRLEYLVRAIKEYRNSVCHEFTNITHEEMFNRIEEVRRIMTLALQKAGERYKVSSQEIDTFVQELNEEINMIRDTPVSPADQQQYMQQVLSQNVQLKNLLHTKAREELKTVYSSWSRTDPVGFLLENNTMDISKIFTRLEVVAEIENSSSKSVQFEDLLELKSDNGNAPSLILVEGVAGSGKSTLLKHIMSDWSNNGVIFHGIKQFELLLYIKCRDHFNSSFYSFLSSLLPSTSCYLRLEDIVRSVLDSKVLILVDGLDEMNYASKKLLRDVFYSHQIGSRQNIQLICTTRPEMIDEFYKQLAPRDLEVSHLKLTGIALDKREEFVTRYCNQIDENCSYQKTEGLIKYLKTSSAQMLDLWRLPLNLVLLTMFWITSPDALQWLTSGTSLYMAFFTMTQQKLVERLKHRKGIQNLTTTEIQKRCNDFLEVAYRESLLSLHNDTMYFSKESITLLRDICNRLGLPCDEVFSAFFTLNRRWTISGIEEEIGIPHKGLHDFYASLSVVTVLTSVNDRSAVDNIVKNFQKILIANNIPVGTSSNIIRFTKSQIIQKVVETKTIASVFKDLRQGEDLDDNSLSKYQNVLIHLAGVLKKRDGDLIGKFSEELVRLLKTSGMWDPEQWLDVLAEAECEPKMVKCVSQVIPLERWKIRDGQLEAASLLLKHASVQHIEINIERDPQNPTYLLDLLKELSQTFCEVQLNFSYLWRNPNTGCADDYLSCLTPSKHRKGFQFSKFMGSVENLSNVNEKLEVLFLSLGEVYANSRDRSPDHLVTKMKKMENLYLHIVAGLDVTLLPRIPDLIFPIDLWLSNVGDGDINWAAATMRTLQPSRTTFWSLRFPESKLTEKGCRDLLVTMVTMKDLKLGGDGVIVSSADITSEDEDRLNQMFKGRLSIPFRLTDSEKIWNF